jgi:hypothetical protein
MSSTTEETKQTLPVGHPNAGYVAPTHEDVQGTGTVPDAEQSWYDDRVEAQKAENDAVAENEDKVAQAEDDEAEVEPTSTSKSSTSTSKTSTSSGSSSGS